MFYSLFFLDFYFIDYFFLIVFFPSNSLEISYVLNLYYFEKILLENIIGMLNASEPKIQ